MPKLKEVYKDIEFKIEVLSNALRAATKEEDVTYITHKREDLRDELNHLALEMFKNNDI